MIYVELDKTFLVYNSGTSDGTQSKYFKDGYWYKTDLSGNEGEVEYLCSGVLQFSTLNTDEYVVYEHVKINEKKGCRSKNFLEKDESFITFNRLHKNTTGVSLHKKIMEYSELTEQITYVIDFIRLMCDIDVTDYLRKIFTLDYIILNEDRHFNNLGIIMREDGCYRTAPIFDNGKSLLNGNFSIKSNLPISENVKRVVARPFGGTHKKIFEFFGKGFDLDISNAIEWVRSQRGSYTKDVLLYQLTMFEKEKVDDHEIRMETMF